MFDLIRTERADQIYREVKGRAFKSLENRKNNKKAKSSPIEGLFKQIHKTLELLAQNPRHPGLQTHPYDSIPNPYQPDEKVFEAYAQNQTPGAYRIFWCYGPGKRQITILAITPHP